MSTWMGIAVILLGVLGWVIFMWQQEQKRGLRPAPAEPRMKCPDTVRELMEIWSKYDAPV